MRRIDVQERVGRDPTPTSETNENTVTKIEGSSSYRGPGRKRATGGGVGPLGN